MSETNEQTIVQISYDIAGSSGCSGQYVAENVLEDNPMDSTSRWSSAVSFQESPDGKQWILLRLQDVAVLKSITFGKTHKAHPCNMKEFKVYVGMSEEDLMEVLEASLENNDVKETFSLCQYSDTGFSPPAKFVKVEPLSVYGHISGFHTSIWHIALEGLALA